ncbi:hypothetical protein LTS18_007893 [Coniosporium uncinatum]|uniref:Uncharacterized protein n=1 Tax=Coniosporium uncinatum TaxID=93489 RepID=A0ACC3D255_9PEZI|nr:hypothetical protein LTS18_007893 [Coniosporium uncinatum]
MATMSHTTQTDPIPEPLINSATTISSEKSGLRQQGPISAQARPPPASPSLNSTASTVNYVPIHSDPNTTSASAPPPPAAQSGQLSDSVRQLLPLLHAQSPHYITAHIYNRPYLLTAGDTLRLPFLMHGVQPGDVLRLDRASTIGSRDYTLKSGASLMSTQDLSKDEIAFTPVKHRTRWIDDRLFVCRATVTGVESEPMRVMEKTKRRQRHIKHVKSKHRYTVLRISEVKVKSLGEVEAEIATSSESGSVEGDVVPAAGPAL